MSWGSERTAFFRLTLSSVSRDPDVYTISWFGALGPGVPNHGDQPLLLRHKEGGHTTTKGRVVIVKKTQNINNIGLASRHTHLGV